MLVSSSTGGAVPGGGGGGSVARGAQREVAEVLRGGGQDRGVRGRQAAPRGGAGGVRDGAHDLQLLHTHLQHQVFFLKYFFQTLQLFFQGRLPGPPEGAPAGAGAVHV